MNNNRWAYVYISTLLAIVLGFVGYAIWIAPKPQLPTPAKVTKKAPAKPSTEWRMGQLEYKVTALEGRVTKLETTAPAPAPAPVPSAPKKGLTVVIEEPTPPTPPVVTTPTAPKDNGWRPVLTDSRWLRLGPPSQVPPPKVPVKGIEGPDIR